MVSEGWPLSLVVFPVLVFLARILDVSVATMRIIMVARGRKYLAAALGFIESLVWILAVTQVMQNLSNWVTYVAFAMGFGAGNYIGLMIEEKLAMGNLIIRVITRQDAEEMIHFLWKSGYGVTSIDGWGETGPVKLIFTVCRRRHLEQIIAIIKEFNPKAFYTIEDVRFVNETYVSQIPPRRLFSRRLRSWK
ncbi:MAG: DUF2179 domain-containing protein [Deltaproteobacteria bacterium]|nr:DUF2179 domain-containing protein [Deltaproteobacteria bacterium]